MSEGPHEAGAAPSGSAGEVAPSVAPAPGPEAAHPAPAPEASTPPAAAPTPALASASEPSPAGSGRAKTARPVTASVLRAAAQTPADVRDLVVAERRAREARDRPAESPPDGDREASDDLLEGLPPSKPSQGPQPPRVSRVKRRRSGSSIERLDDDRSLPPPATAPDDGSSSDRHAGGARGGGSSLASAVGESRPEARPDGGPVATPAAAPPTATVPPPARPPALPTPPQTARPAAPVAAPPVVPAPRPVAPRPASPAAPAPAPIVVAPAAPRIEVHQPVAPIVVALLFGACMVALAALKGAQAVARELDEASAARAAPALAPPPATSAASAAGAAGPQLAPLGNGRVVWATPDGRLVVLVPDPLSGELAVERVYAVVEDRERHLGDRDRRHLHGYYVDDLEAARRDALLGARARYEAAVDAAAHSPADLDHAERAAEALVAAGGADVLAPDLAAVGVGVQVTVASVRRRCAALALGEAGYLRAVRPLTEQLRSASTDYGARLVPLLARLTGLTLDAGDAGRALAAVDAWLSARPEVTGFERR